MADQRVNGWSNYPTWNLALWLSNSGESEMYTEEAIRRRMTTKDLADWIENDIQEAQDGIKLSGAFADIFGWALGQINFYEIAESYIDDDPEKIEED